MYARFFSFNSDSAKRPAAEAMADKAHKFMKDLPGFISVHFVISENEDEYGSFSLWETKSAANAAGDSIRAEIGTVLQNISSGDPGMKLFEVYKPK